MWCFGFLKFENCVDPSFRNSSSKQKAKGVNLVSVFLRHNFLLPSNFLTLPFLIVTLQSLIKFWLFGHWPRKFARWLIGSTKKVISIYTFWVIVLLLRWFMNHNSCNSLLVILRYLIRSMVVGSSTGQAKYLDQSRNLSKLLTKDRGNYLS